MTAMCNDVRFIKMLRYELRPPDCNTYEFVARLGFQEEDPPTLEPGALDPGTPIVYHSPLSRASGCLLRREGVRYEPLAQLSEILFDLRKLCTEEEWRTKGSVQVRRGLRLGFIEDTLPQSRNRIFAEIRSALRLIGQHEAPEIPSAVSHSFRMKLIEAYAKTDGAVERRPSLINAYLADEEKTFANGEGFSLSLDKVRELARLA